MSAEVTKTNEHYDIPILALLGEDDPIFDVEESKNLLSFYFKNKKIVELKGVSHYPHIDAKDKFFKELRSFLL